MNFSNQIRVHFDQADPAGFLFFGNIFKLAHQSIEEMISCSQIGWKSWFQSDQNIGAPIRHAEADFKIPLAAGNLFNVDINLHTLSKSSVTFKTSFSSDLGVHAVVKTVHTFVDLSQTPPKKIDIPQSTVAHFLKK